nr:MAG TPA: hypothetical protein [Caudoviricetes sp.]
MHDNHSGRANAFHLRRVLQSINQSKVGRDPLFSWKRPRHLPQRLRRPFCRRQLWHG